MYTRIFATILLLMVLFNCGTSKRKVNGANLEKLNALIQNDTLYMVMQWANPLNVVDLANTNLLPADSRTGNINLIGNPNYFKIIGDSLSIALPYYGERQMGGVYNPNDIGIEFNGKPDVFRKSFNEKKHAYEYYFEANNNSEFFQINLSIFSNLKTNVSINSSVRTVISYRGHIKEES